MTRTNFENSGDGVKQPAFDPGKQPTNLVDLFMSERTAQVKDQKDDGRVPQAQPGEFVPFTPQSAATPGGDGAQPQVCPESPVYNNYIDRVARRIFDPSILGNLDQLKSKYNCEIDRTKDPVRYVRQALHEDPDPYTSYLNKEEYAKLNQERQGNLVGAGITFQMPTAAEEKSGQPIPLIVHNFEGTATRGLGIQPGDEVVAIDGVSTKGKTWREGLGMLDGAENSDVTVRVLRDGKEKDVVLKRTKEVSPAVETQMVDGDKFAHIRVKTFMNESTAKEIEKAILDNPKAEGYILDLRHNPGGLLDQAFTSASIFINEGKVLTVKERVPSDPSNPKYAIETYSISKDAIQKAQDASEPTRYSSRFPDRVHKPVVVLVDQGTASAAEILAGALKDTDGAYVIGTPTYGKGIGQSIMPDYDTEGALKITTFQYYTPSGFWPGDGAKMKIGITPNQFVPNVAPAKLGTIQDGQLNAGIDFLRTAK